MPKHGASMGATPEGSWDSDRFSGVIKTRQDPWVLVGVTAEVRSEQARFGDNAEVTGEKPRDKSLSVTFALTLVHCFPVVSTDQAPAANTCLNALEYHSLICSQELLEKIPAALRKLKLGWCHGAHFSRQYPQCESRPPGEPFPVCSSEEKQHRCLQSTAVLPITVNPSKYPASRTIQPFCQ